jgi:hypothetical protein
VRKIQDLFTAEDAEVQSEDPFLFYCFFLCVALRPCGEKIFCRLSFRFEVTVQDRDYLGGKIMADKFEAKLLGVLGGMGPMAGAVFMERLTAMTKVQYDQQHIPAVLWSDPRVPDRTQAKLHGGEDPLPWLLNGIRHLGAGRGEGNCHPVQQRPHVVCGDGKRDQTADSPYRQGNNR